MLHVHFVSSTEGWWDFSIIKIFGHVIGIKNQQIFSDIKTCQCHVIIFLSCFPIVFLYLVLLLLYIWFYSRTIDLCDDIEKIVGSRPRSSKKCSIYHWNLNRITANCFVETAYFKKNVIFSNLRFT